jgi:hypothetical protein
VVAEVRRSIIEDFMPDDRWVVDLIDTIEANMTTTVPGSRRLLDKRRRASSKGGV